MFFIEEHREEIDNCRRVVVEHFRNCHKWQGEYWIIIEVGKNDEITRLDDKFLMNSLQRERKKTTLSLVIQITLVKTYRDDCFHEGIQSNRKKSESNSSFDQKKIFRIPCSRKNAEKTIHWVSHQQYCDCLLVAMDIALAACSRTPAAFVIWFWLMIGL